MAGLWRDRVRGGAATRKKPIVARANEDAVLCRAVDGAIGVFDGIGMYSQARLASKVARERCVPLLRAMDRANYASTDDALLAIGQALMAAQEGVVELQRQFPHAGDGGTTATIAKLWQPTPDAPVVALYANIGDSRLYQWSASERTLYRLTSDDNVLHQWRDMGWIDEATADAVTEQIDTFSGEGELSPLALQAWEQRNTICAWLGMPDISFSVGTVTLAPRDRLIAMSDGIHDNLTVEEMIRIVKEPAEPREIALHLIDVAEAIAFTDESPRAKPDDMSAVVLIFDK